MCARCQHDYDVVFLYKGHPVIRYSVQAMYASDALSKAEQLAVLDGVTFDDCIVECLD